MVTQTISPAALDYLRTSKQPKKKNESSAISGEKVITQTLEACSFSQLLSLKYLHRPKHR